jgi:nitrite reductase/ring-hydroxylating ferredoxin subunit
MDHKANPPTSLSYSGYYRRPPADESTLLTAVGPGEPAGEYLRRFWHPFCLVSEIGDTPKPVRLLGENLVVFKDLGGRWGLLHRQCVHRGTSLEFGIPQERGIRCCYHGWQFDIDGKILERPGEAAPGPVHSSYCQGAYPVIEQHGLLFAYLGPPEKKPVFPTYDSYDHPEPSRHAPFRIDYDCNWLQVVENACDPIHNVYLHAIVSGQQFSPAFAVLPALDFPETPLGFEVVATREVNGRAFIRSADIIMPNIAQFTGALNGATHDCFGVTAQLTRWVTPIDDENSFYIGHMHINPYTNMFAELKPEYFGVGKLGLIGQTTDRPYVERQREPGDYDAVVSQGPSANRKAEHLGVTDRGIVQMRRILAREIARVQADEEPSLPLDRTQEFVRTYCHELALTLPEARKVDQAKLSAFGKQVLAIIAKHASLPPAEREAEAHGEVKALVARHFAA